MAAPIIGPTVKLHTRPGPNNGYNLYERRETYVQAKPVDRPLPYVYDYGAILSRNGDNSSVTEWRLEPQVSNSRLIGAYDRLKSSAQEQAELGVAILEARSAVSMMANRLLQLAKFARLLLRGRIAEAARHLGVLRPKGASRRKKFADLWLEFSFGWKPLVQDIYSAVDVLQNPLTSSRIKGSYSFSWTYKQTSAYNYTREHTTFGQSYLTMGAEVVISNPNLYLANQLGLINPFSIAWELVPFSFVVDWFSNLGQVLALGSDFLGLSVTNKWTVYGAKGITSYQWRGHPWASEVYQHRFVRTTSWSLPTVGLRPAKLWGWQRAANAASLLIQLLSGRR